MHVLLAGVDMQLPTQRTLTLTKSPTSLVRSLATNHSYGDACAQTRRPSETHPLRDAPISRSRTSDHFRNLCILATCGGGQTARRPKILTSEIHWDQVLFAAHGHRDCIK